MTINLTREDFEQAIKSGASVFEGNTIPDTGKPSGRYYRFIRVPTRQWRAQGRCLVRAAVLRNLGKQTRKHFNQEIRFLLPRCRQCQNRHETQDFKTIFCRSLLPQILS